MSDTIVRKTGDTLIIRGTLEGENIPPAGEWPGAAATISISRSGSRGSVVRDRAAVTLTPATRAFEYIGATLPVGTYNVEIEVVFANGRKLTWPNYGHVQLSMLARIA